MHIRSILSATLWFGCVSSSSSFTVHALQSQGDGEHARKFVLDSTFANDPVQIAGFRISGVTVGPNEVFSATDEDWLRYSTAIVKNRSNKEIVGVWITLSFPEIKDGDATVVDFVQIGNTASSEMYTPSGKRLHDNDNPIFSVGPGEKALIPLGANYENTKSLRLRANSSTTATICRVRLNLVYFRNGMKWSPGIFARPDPDHPGHFLAISATEFYADMRAR